MKQLVIVLVLEIIILSATLYAKECREEKGRLPYYILEELPTRTLIGNVAIDAKLTEKYDKHTLKVLRYTFHNPDRTQGGNLFEIDEQTGILKTARRIDRDHLCPKQAHCLVCLEVLVRPDPYSRSIPISVDILDVNDHTPVFSQNEIQQSVSEISQPGMSFKVPTAVDLDSQDNGDLRYELVAESSKFRLRQNERNGGSRELEIVLLETLDREQTEMYKLKLLARDNGKPSKSGSALVNVLIEDANDNNPLFDKTTYTILLNETTAVGTTVVRVHASDTDHGQNGDILYKFTDRTIRNYGHLFVCVNETGEIILKHDLKFEGGSTFLLMVMATDRGQGSRPAHATVIIRVEDLSNKSPQIDIGSLTASGILEVPENSPRGTVLATVNVNDLRRDQFDCFLQHSKFDLIKRTARRNREYKIISHGGLDREVRSNYDLLITCEDDAATPRMVVRQIAVKVTDLNDNAPVFSKQIYVATIKENNNIGEKIVTVNASDQDGGSNGEISYKIHTDYNSLFRVDPRSGAVFADAIFNRERLQEITFNVVAYDFGTPSLSATATIVLTITDQNDEAPIFSQSGYAFGVYENEPANTDVGILEATDPDTESFGRLIYKMESTENEVSNSFGIHQSDGRLYTKLSLDRETNPVFYMTVLAVSEGSPSMTSSTSVTVYVADKNDNAPIIDWPTIYNNTVHISNQVPVDSDFTQIKAHDFDIGGNGKLTYEIEAGNEAGLFEISTAFGRLTVANDLRDVTNQLFALTIKVRDHGFPKKTTVTHLNIIVNQTLSYVPNQEQIIYSDNNPTIISSLTTVAVILIVLVVIMVILLRKYCVEDKPTVMSNNCSQNASCFSKPRPESQTMLRPEQLVHELDSEAVETDTKSNVSEASGSWTVSDRGLPVGPPQTKDCNCCIQDSVPEKTKDTETNNPSAA